MGRSASGPSDTVCQVIAGGRTSVGCLHVRRSDSRSKGGTMVRKMRPKRTDGTRETKNGKGRETTDSRPSGAGRPRAATTRLLRSAEASAVSGGVRPPLLPTRPSTIQGNTYPPPRYEAVDPHPPAYPPGQSRYSAYPPPPGPPGPAPSAPPLPLEPPHGGTGSQPSAPPWSEAFRR